MLHIPEQPKSLKFFSRRGNKAIVTQKLIAPAAAEKALCAIAHRQKTPFAGFMLRVGTFILWGILVFIDKSL